MNEQPLHGFAHEAMNSVFRILVPESHVEEAHAASAAEAAWRLLDRLEDDLSRYRGNSDITRINQLGVGESVRVSLGTFDCLALARAVTAETGGAFNIAVGPLMDVFRAPVSTFLPKQGGFEEAARQVRWDGIDLDDDTQRVTKTKEGVSLDLGAIGKGYALDQMAVVLEQEGVTCAFLDAGRSTLLATGAPAGHEGWPIGVGSRQVFLQNHAASGSGFLEQGAHLMDPEKGRPLAVDGSITWAMAPTAAMSDALSTAFAIMPRDEAKALCERFPEVEVHYSDELSPASTSTTATDDPA